MVKPTPTASSSRRHAPKSPHSPPHQTHSARRTSQTPTAPTSIGPQPHRRPHGLGPTWAHAPSAAARQDVSGRLHRARTLSRGRVTRAADLGVKGSRVQISPARQSEVPSQGANSSIEIFAFHDRLRFDETATVCARERELFAICPANSQASIGARPCSATKNSRATCVRIRAGQPPRPRHRPTPRSRHGEQRSAWPPQP